MMHRFSEACPEDAGEPRPYYFWCPVVVVFADVVVAALCVVLFLRYLNLVVVVFFT